MASDNAGRAEAVSQKTQKNLTTYEHGYGYVYLLSSSEGYWKIGSSNDAERRFEQIAPALPFKVKLECVFHCAPGNEKQAERLLHRKFADKRTNGEWFKLDEEDLQFFMQDPIPIGLALSHSLCYAQGCLGGHCEEHIMEQMLGLS